MRCRLRVGVPKRQSLLEEGLRVNAPSRRNASASQEGVQHPTFRSRLGHQTIQITMDLYSHVMPTVQRAAVDAFANLLA
jgi:integrase